MNIKKNIAAFTLVEVMTVVAIIGLLAAISIPNFAQARTNARRSTCINNLRLIDAAKEQYALENNVDIGGAVVATDVAPYLRGNAMPTCPGSGTYTIDVVGTKPSCSLTASPDLHVLPN